MVREEAPGMVVVLVAEQNAHPGLVRRALGRVVPPDDAQEERPGGAHDGNVRQQPIPIVLGQHVNYAQEERMTRDRAHGVVGDARRHRAADPGRV